MCNHLASLVISPLAGLLAVPKIVHLSSNAKSAAEVPNCRSVSTILHIQSKFVVTLRPIANTA